MKFCISLALPKLIFPILPTIFANLLCSSSRSVTSLTEVPDPLATLVILEGTIEILPSSSSSVIESIMHINLLILAIPSFSLPFSNSPEFMPGIIDMSWLIDPILRTVWNCSYMSRKLNFPWLILFINSGCFSLGIASWTTLKSLSISPSPRSLLIKLFASNCSKSSNCSPVPIKIIGDSVAATALKAPPPFAWPSSFVTITLPTLTDFLKANAWS
mmetsp:Transcript_13918/g.13912  ORF Transcript_13918/g.13912 Transcript_13918/m.13912 type:complete len:216 (-) Transcript_13918:698-1345(-)